MTAPAGLIDPFGPALAVIVSGFRIKLTAIVWTDVTSLKVYVLFVKVAGKPSTVNTGIKATALGVTVNVWLAPLLTIIAPDGVILPSAPELAVIVKFGIKLATSYEQLLRRLSYNPSANVTATLSTKTLFIV